MKLNLGISAMLVTAVLAGAAGGAVALSAAQGTDGPAAPSVSLHQVADEPTSAPAPAATSEPTQPAPAPAAADDPASVSEPAPIVEPVAPKTETAQEAADRAKAEADRAKLEADRAATIANTPAPAPVVAPVVTPTATPEPKPRDCVDGKNGATFESVTSKGTYSKVCRDGEWVVTAFKPAPTPTPAPPTTEDPAPVGG